MTIEEISGASGYSSRQLRRWFDEYLDEYPTWNIKTTAPVYLLIDGTYYSDGYSDGHCLIVYRAENLRRTLFYRFARAEDDDEIASDLMAIREMGYEIAGITTDGGDNIVRAAEYVYPGVPRQRCMVHVRRECLNRITLQPRSPEARALKDLVLRIGDVRTANDRLWWLRSFRDWDELNAAFACEKAARPGGQTYFVRDDLRKAYVHLKRAIPNLFTFVDHPGLPKTTNALEAFFGHLKDQWNAAAFHQPLLSLSPTKNVNYTPFSFHLCSRQAIQGPPRHIGTKVNCRTMSRLEGSATLHPTAFAPLPIHTSCRVGVQITP